MHHLRARHVHVRGIVQGVGFRPYVFRLANVHALHGWVLNGGDGVRIHVEGSEDALDTFVHDLAAHPPPAAQIAAISIEAADVAGCARFEIRHSDDAGRPTTRIAPDLPTCDACLREMLDPADRHHRYPYINCTNCGPRFSIVRALPYDRAHTTMAEWPMCPACAAEYHDPSDRRFHAQPVACPACGPRYRLVRLKPDATDDGLEPVVSGFSRTITGDDAVREAARLLRGGRILAVKGVGGYHLACDADNAAAVASLRERKYRKEKAFAIMVRDVSVARATIDLTPAVEVLLESAARPIVLAPARVSLPGVAPGNHDLGVMLPYTPLHHLFFASGAPARLVMTSGNRSSEPIAYDDDDARRRLEGLADAFVIGERPIARRVDDSVMRAGTLGPTVLRRSRGLAPGAVAVLPTRQPILALGGDLKNAVTLVVDGQAYVSQHIGDLADHGALQAFEETIRDLTAMYDVAVDDLVVVHDAHPQYASTLHAASFAARQTIAVQHHRAHVASALAEVGAFDRRVLGIAFDGTGYGDDGAIWGGEFFTGSIREGFERVAHLRQTLLPGGDAAARHPVQAAAGFLAEVDHAADLTQPPFDFPRRYDEARAVLRSGLRTFPTTSAGRLFDTVAALVGFTRPMAFEGQAAMWFEHVARGALSDGLTLPMAFDGSTIDWRETLAVLIDARVRGVTPAILARAFHRSLAGAMADAIRSLSARAGIDAVVLSGGVIQNEMLLDDLRRAVAPDGIELLINHQVPANDGGLSLGQAALALRRLGED